MVQGEEHRKDGRRRTLFGGTIYDESGQSFDCSVSDISTSGVKVKTKTEFEIGDAVDLRINKFNDLRPCHVIWKREGAIGLRFEVHIDPYDPDMADLFKLI